MATAQDLLEPNYIQINLDDTLAHAASTLLDSKESGALVFDEDEFMGVITSHAFLTSRQEFHTTKVSNLLKKRSKSKTPFHVPQLHPDMNLPQMISLFNSSRSPVLPVEKDGSIIGIVTSRAIAIEIAKQNAHIRLEQVSEEAVTLNESDSLDTLLTLLVHGKTEHVVVMSNGEFSGIITPHDYMRAALHARTRMHMPAQASHDTYKNSGFDTGEKTDLGSGAVRDLMNTSVIYAHYHATLQNALELMEEHSVRSIVVLRGEEPLGIVTDMHIISLAIAH